MPSKALGGMVLVALLLRSSSPGTVAPPVSSSSLEVPRVLTGNTPSWFADRYALALEVLTPNVPAAVLRDVTLSILAQWAHETARGKSEFNFNLGGWRAAKGEPFFSARDVQSGEATSFKWRAFRDLPNAVAQQLERLNKRFPSAWAKLIAQPTSSAWVEELGRKGYYGAKPAAYAQAWGMHRAELGRLVS